MLKNKHLIFDLDGTIYDTDLSIFKMWTYLLNKEFPEFEVDQFDLRKTLGISTESAMELMGLPYTDEFDQMFTIHYSMYAHLISIYKDMDKAIIALYEKGYKLGIVSSRPYREYNAYLKPLGLDSYFTYKVLKDDTEVHKPNPEPILKYINDNNIVKEECIYIGDMKTDVLCAKNAGIKSALMIWDKNKTIEVEPDYKFYSASELLDFFECE